MPFLVAAGRVEPAVPMGMNKDNVQSIGGDQTTRVVGWVVRPNYSRTVIDKDALVATTPGDVVVRTQVTLQGGWSTDGKLWAQLMRGGTEIQRVEFAKGQSVATLPPLPLTLAVGDRISLNMISGNAFSTAIPGGAGTYVYFEAA